jgi:hypothetical protein
MSEQIRTDDISKALNFTDDQLFELIGTAESSRIGTRTDDAKKLIAQGKAWWSEKEAELRPVICSNGAVQHLVGGPALDIAQAVYSAIFPEVKSELAIYACALVARAGISNWCGPIWQNR